ncbi:MAG: hypothetical protein RLZZ254_577 [Actinomycetota bacterium]
MKFGRKQNHVASPSHVWRREPAAAAVGVDPAEQCPLCGRNAVWQWWKTSQEGEVTHQIPLCDSHQDELKLNEDGSWLHGRSGVGVFPRIMTADDVRAFLGYRHWIPAGRGWKSTTQIRFSDRSDNHLLEILKKLCVLKRSSHFSGWEVRDHIEWVIFRSPTQWESVITSKWDQGTSRTSRRVEDAPASTPRGSA